MQNTTVSTVALLNNAVYRMHRFRSTASPIKGLTADILVRSMLLSASFKIFTIF